MPAFYILLRDHTAKQRNGILNNPIKSREHKLPVQVLKGSLWKSLMQTETLSKYISLEAVCSKEDIYLECPENDVHRVTTDQCELLKAVLTCEDRYKVFQDKSWLSEALHVQEGSIVYVLKVEDPGEKLIGKVRFKGQIDELGIKFGVELSAEYAGKGTSDGTFRRKRYFNCPEDCGLFVAINKLRLCQKKELFKKNGPSDEYQVHSPVEHEVEFNDRSLSPPPIEIGERVVWLGDDGAHFGTVHWLGILEDARNEEWTVGVEFDEPVGTGTGKYHDTQLFKAKPKHASLIPLIGLLKASEFGDPVKLNGAAPNHGAFSPNTDSYSDNSFRPSRNTGTPGQTLDERYYRESYRTDEFQVPALPPKSRGAEEKSYYETIGSRDYANQPFDNTYNMSRSSSTRENFIDDPYARVEDWRSKVEPGTPAISASHSPNSQQMSPSAPPATPSSRTSEHERFGSSAMRGPETIYAQVHRDPESRSSHSNGYNTYSNHNSSYPNTQPPPYNTLGYTDQVDSKDQSGAYARTKTTVRSPGYVVADGDSAIDRTSSNRHSAYPNSQRNSSYRTGTMTEDSGYVHSEMQGGRHDRRQFSPSPPPRTTTTTTPPTPKYQPRAIDPRTLGSDIDLGSMVEVNENPEHLRYGVIRWVGYLEEKSLPVVGLEMEEESDECSYGYWHGQKIFELQTKKALFVHSKDIKKDSRFNESHDLLERTPSKVFGNLECPDVKELVPPLRIVTDINPYLGKGKGIQGHHNSCYLDATLYSMFSFTTLFDSLLLRDPNERDIKELNDVQIIMREGIVYPLRKNFYVRADKVLKLRTLLDKVTNLKGLMTEEKDPEEFLNCLFQQVLKATPYLTLNSNQESFLYQLFFEKEEQLIVPTTEQLLELSFHQSNIKLRQVPSCLMIQMPRFGKDYKMYRKILPSLELDITDLLEHGPRECHNCGQLASYECSDCFELTERERGLYKCSFCDGCVRTFHTHPKRTQHLYKPMQKNKDFEQYIEAMQKLGHHVTDEPLPREKMELFAVICIETSHYVSFVKCGSGVNAPWVFFDSMADREGAENGYNIPEVKPCNFLPDLLLDKKKYHELINMTDDKKLDPYARRLLCDAYICMYQNADLQMYS